MDNSTQRSYYSASLKKFISDIPEAVLGALTLHHTHATEPLQRNAWIAQIDILKTQLVPLGAGHIFLEFGIPRMGKRADVVIVYRGIVFVIEFKVGAIIYLRSDITQAVDYGLDLKNFHEGSHHVIVVPILVATQAPRINNELVLDDDRLSNCLLANAENISDHILHAIAQLPPQQEFDACTWAATSYKPTPTIIQAAKALYRGHDVKEISRSDASAKNLTDTAKALAEIIERSKSLNQKSICFVTGVPGAGKTLAGLNITTNRMRVSEEENAVFLSGNGPLVLVLREALARDEAKQKNITKKIAMQHASAFIQNVHSFRDEYLLNDSPTIEGVVVFDEAQRAWNRDQTASFMKQKRGLLGFDQSEPEFLIGVMNRNPNWSVIIALIGGGQEINTGEAGLPEWFSALRRRYPHWQVYYSSAMDSDEYIQGGNLDAQVAGLKASSHPGLHLGVSIRSFRAEKLSAFVHYLVSNEPVEARQIFQQISSDYPIYVTRDIIAAKSWLRTQARGGELHGILASSSAGRLKPYGINVKYKISPAEWFLNGPDDVRSCQYLEDIATEFDVQGLELDWCCVGWDADLRYRNGQWHHYAFKGTKWQSVKQIERQRFLVNAYRVLLTRSRQGFVIFIPEGSPDDPTRPSGFYNDTYNYLKSCGIPTLS